MEIIKRALDQGRNMLSEHESKELLSTYGIPVTKERIVQDTTQLKEAASEIGYPIVLKAHSPSLAHKTEKGLIRVDIRNDQEASEAFNEIMGKIEGSEKAVLVQEMIKGQRELVVGLTRDPQFGPCVMFGLGGIFTEILKDISFRVAPLEKRDALEMMKDIKGHKILDAVRGMPSADLDALADILITVGRMGLENNEIKEIDINPLILKGSKPVAVDALVVLEAPHP
ncbi:MAG: acetate--CoA ligase family protein [Deltaproteobacteria bacterium]|nr:acetate--CoA ligase family protein [Deltaproteobacteria bacterium]MBW1929942.1 acetate--CoA ligase family protein [Deltaproteobacteria bacterium]MBW2025946.1 acetate--CoA ligase family protein [Deltaproteobacteria bacterium]RLB23098.1 MAG: carboxylate--amine ligase [Deltaproteobacteria bacterium]